MPDLTELVGDFLGSQGLERMEWPAQSPGFSPLEHVWDYLGRQGAASSPPPRSLRELVILAWSSLPIKVSDNLISNMENRCRQCIAVRGGYITY